VTQGGAVGADIASHHQFLAAAQVVAKT
jgi:hypothetical protein